MYKSDTIIDSTKFKKTKRNVHFYFLSPALLTIIVIMIVPLAFSIYISLNDANLLENGGKFSYIGLKNYINFFNDERALKSVLTTIKFTAGAILSEVVLGIFISLFLDRNFKGKSIVRSLLIVPMFMTPVVTGLIWRTFFDPTSGILNYFLGLFGLGSSHDWLGDIHLALPSIILADVWQWTPFVILLFMASLDSISEDIYEAARVSGANEFYIIRYIKLPLLVPTLLIAIVLRLIDSIKAFDLIYVMTKGGPGLATETINMYTYIVGFNFFRLGYVTAVSYTFTLVITVVLSNIIMKTLKKSDVNI